ncbi:uncharacterized protein EI97DRAFT_435871 [Westerdykella ornata]|uniref:SMP-LTD domain-containing protein n=1 Tax=Westerdykella ornata TaxID=318751 RepID=A0A6A6JB97_WESOR|nr:uncharacterized protein EI97DRAFT_435871 [Westerdykella ornata]KAF2273702.1 hypothetical protein EI97DRAFT_435871 [Westerdykella ornata]
MSGWKALLAAYLLGGITFIPLVLGLVFLHAYATLPVHNSIAEDQEKVQGNGNGVSEKDKSQGTSSSSSIDGDASIFDALPPELKSRTARTHVPDVAAGYFAVCREYVPGGMNGKPPERTTPAGAVVAAESPSVYQAMYRSIFERGKSMSPTLDVGNGTGGGGKGKRGRNVFYVVLRLGILMLYDDSEQLEVRHVISLAHYDVDIYSGGDKIPEGELWIKRNCIRLTHRSQGDKLPSDAKPYFLFSDNCSDKEDFYHAMLQSQDHRNDIPRSPPRPLKFDTTDLVRLVQQLHASEEYLHTRWINALIGRVFLAMYKTEQVEQFIWNKITKKISRVPKPALISKIDLQKVDMGNLPPFITNPKLRELTMDGDLTVEADVSYKGNFQVEISAVARIELGSRFKNRDFTTTLGLAATLKKLEGHVLLRVKPPPSNRLWITFETAPKMELALEPIWGSRQITYGPILRAMESRLREVVGETLVLPNWDDFPFKDTELSEFRGGIWTSDRKKEREKEQGKAAATATKPAPEAGEGDGEAENRLREMEYGSEDEAEGQISNLPTSRLESKPTSSTATVSSLELADVQTPMSSPAASMRPSVKPKAMRSSSFANAASPIVNVDAASASATKTELKERQQDAAAAMKTISLSQPGSPTDTPVGSPPQFNHMESALEKGPSVSSVKLQQIQQDHDATSVHSTRPYSSSSHSAGSQSSISQVQRENSAKSTSTMRKGKHASSASLPRNAFTPTAERRHMINQSINSAASAAKKWWNSKQQGGGGPTSPSLSNITNAIKHGPASPLPREQPSTPLSTSAPEESLHGHEHEQDGSLDTHGASASLPSGPASTTSTTTPSTIPTSTSTTTVADNTAPLGSPANPIGRGQLIPESGLLSPKPEKKGWAGVVPGAATFVGMTKRKPVVQRKAVGSQGQGPGSGQGQEEMGKGTRRDGDEGADDNEKERVQRDKENGHHHQRGPGQPSSSSTSRTSTSTSSTTTNFPSHQQHRQHGHERKASVGTAAMGMGNRKKSSSIQSLPSPSLSSAGNTGQGYARRQRRAVTESAGSGSGVGLGFGGGDGEGDGVFVVEAPRDLEVDVDGDEVHGFVGRQGSRDSGGSAGSGVGGDMRGDGEEVEGSVFTGMEGVDEVVKKE